MALAGADKCSPYAVDVVLLFPDDAADSIPRESAPMLPLCNRPLLWYCVVPWLRCGFRRFFLCLSGSYLHILQDYISSEPAFRDVEFHLVVLENEEGGGPFACRAVRAFLRFKAALMERAVETARATGAELSTELRSMAAMPRDAVLVSGETVLAGVDLSLFVRLFYSSMASVSALLYRPIALPKPKKDGGGGGKRQGRGATLAATASSFVNMCSDVIYEEGDPMESMRALSTAATSPSFNAANMAVATGPAAAAAAAFGEAEAAEDTYGAAPAAVLQQRRLHFLGVAERGVRMRMPFAARRPHMICAADLCDAQVYAVQNWALHYLARAEDAEDLQDAIATLAENQHTVINRAQDVVLTPDRRIEFSIPVHWMHAARPGTLPVQILNAAPGTPLPERYDCLRVFAAILTERAEVPARVYRLDCIENYMAAQAEILLVKKDAEERAERLRAMVLEQQEDQQQEQKAGKKKKAREEAESEEPLLPLCRQALADLVPGTVLNCTVRKEGHGIYVTSSFTQSAVPPDVYITDSIIGQGVELGLHARVTGSTLMEQVHVEEGATVTNCIVGMRAVIRKGVTIKDCVVSPSMSVEADATDEDIRPERERGY